MTVYLKSNPNVKAVIIGTRSSDPGCTNVEFMQPSDGNWPKMMRVNPIIKWRYSDIWSFIRYVWKTTYRSMIQTRIYINQ